MPQTNLPQTSNAEQQRSNITTGSAQSEQQKEVTEEEKQEFEKGCSPITNVTTK
jgi:hypothetical protein